MKQSQLTTLKNVLDQLEDLKAEVENVKNELQDEYDNLSIDSQDSEYGIEMESILDSLEATVFDGVDSAVDELQMAVDSLELLPTCDKGEEDDLYDEDDEEEEDWDLDISKSMAAGDIHFGLKAGKREEKPSEKKDNYNPYDTHWESSFDWKDEDNDGYDDRDDGFWQEREF